MPTYFVTSPFVEETAVVRGAPTSEKARTVFLDHLERSGLLPRNRRQEIRATMATKRVGDGVDADVILEYGEETHLPYIVRLPSSTVGEEVEESTKVPEEKPKRLSPIAEVALGSSSSVSI